MSWVGISSNQTVSCNNLQDAVNNNIFTLKNTIPSSFKEITKSEAANYVNINESFPSFYNKTSNELVVKSDLIACASLSWLVIGIKSYTGPDFVGFSTPTEACSAIQTSYLIYSSSTALAVGSELFTTVCGESPVTLTSYDQPDSYYMRLGKYFTLENFNGTNKGYVIRSITSCPPS